MSFQPTIAPEEVLQKLAEANRLLYDFAAEQMRVSRDQGAASVLQLIRQRDAFSQTCSTLCEDFDLGDELFQKFLSIAAGEIR